MDKGRKVSQFRPNMPPTVNIEKRWPALTPSAPPSTLNAMETTVVVIASTLPLALLSLCALFENASGGLTRELRATTPEQRDEEGWRFRGPRVDDLDLRLQRSRWVALPGAVAVSLVPRRVQADALEVLSVLDDLDVYFADCEQDPRQGGR